MKRLAICLVLLAAYLPAYATAGLRRDCRLQCGTAVVNGACGNLLSPTPRGQVHRCFRQLLRRCRHTGLPVCLFPGHFNLTIESAEIMDFPASDCPPVCQSEAVIVGISGVDGAVATGDPLYAFEIQVPDGTTYTGSPGAGPVIVNCADGSESLGLPNGNATCSLALPVNLVVPSGTVTVTIANYPPISASFTAVSMLLGP